MPAGIQLGPWHAPLVIPTTLAPETGKVSWVSMGLRRVPLLAEVLLVFVGILGVSIGSGGCWFRGQVMRGSSGRLKMYWFQV
jgi:hypothetical protein